MNDESTLVLLVGGSLVGVQVVRSGEWAALWARLANVEPGQKGNSQLARDTTGHSNMLYIVGQVGVLVVLVLLASVDSGAGRIILLFLLALWLVYLVTGGQTNLESMKSWLGKFGL